MNSHGRDLTSPNPDPLQGERDLLLGESTLLQEMTSTTNYR